LNLAYKMSYVTKNKKILLTVCVILILVPISADAQELAKDPVVLLQPDLFGSDVVDDENRVRSLGQYLNGLFILGIGVATALAVVTITIGGVQYMVTANSDNKTAAREKITGAVWGLLLALASFVILNTINPDLLKFEIVATIEEAGRSLPRKGSLPPCVTGNLAGLPTNPQDCVTCGGKWFNPPGLCTFPP